MKLFSLILPCLTVTNIISKVDRSFFCTKIAEYKFHWSDNIVKFVQVYVIYEALLHKQVCLFVWQK